MYWPSFVKKKKSIETGADSGVNNLFTRPREICEMCLPGRFQRRNDHEWINVAAENNRHLSNTLLLIHGLACLASKALRLAGTSKRRNFSELETCLKDERKKRIK